MVDGAGVSVLSSAPPTISGFRFIFLRKSRQGRQRYEEVIMRVSKFGSIFLFGLLIRGICFGQELARERVIGKIEVVATFDGAMPTGVSVANDGRIFLNFPRWGDDVEYTVAELRDGKTFGLSGCEDQSLC